MIFCSCSVHTNLETRLLRIHIRANSNDERDQAVKMKVKSTVSEYLTVKLDGVTDFNTAYKIIASELDCITAKANATLKANGFNYGANAKLNYEYFPTRAYEDTVVDGGYYDALIINLGSGRGDNWWCVIYPPLCFISNAKSNDFRYKSLIKELWDKFFGD
ncbi:MAG: stage II sporulation protein R [Clostridia bacterium]|nr:stage II sporulation protein R [Clostridia bacterium]